MQASNQPADISLFFLISRVESNNRANAIRFEEAVYNRQTTRPDIVDKIVRIHNGCSRATAKMIYSSSWGSAQLMGFNLYDTACGFNATVADFMASQEMQKRCFESFCKAKNIFYTPSALASYTKLREKFAKIYNGSLNYQGPLCDALRHFGYVIDDKA